MKSRKISLNLNKANQFLSLSRANENLEICIPVLFELLNESKQFWGTFFVCFNKRELPQKYKTAYTLKTSLYEHIPLREKYPNTEFFLVRIFLFSDEKKLRIWTLLTQCTFNVTVVSNKTVILKTLFWTPARSQFFMHFKKKDASSFP